MKLFLKLLFSLLAALALGIGTALWAINSPPGGDYMIAKGAWHTNLAIGSSRAGMYIRALVSKTGLFALDKTETIYFIADTDDNGERLHSGCDYRIEGKDIDTRWWSITVYGEDYFLIPNEKNRYSFNGRNVMRNVNGNYKIFLTSSPKPGNWLPAGHQDQLYLTLRLYNPQPSVYENPAGIELPKIIKEQCQ